MVIIPISTAWWALTGLRKLVATAIMVREKELNPDLQVRGILCTMIDKKTNVSEDVEKLLRNYFGEQVFTTTIPKNVTLEEAHSRKMSVFDYQPNSPGAKAYNRLVDEILAI